MLVFYNYAGYALIVYLINCLKKRKTVPVASGSLPTVSFIVAAYNEEDCIEKKIINSLEQDYPADRIEFIFITDGSTDSTPEIIRNYTTVQLLHTATRAGKSAALNRAVAAAQNDVLIFSDANTTLNKEATRNIARHYNQKDVGGVAGEKKVLSGAATDATHDAGSEGAYWKYESFLKKIDSDFLTVVGAAGELFSVRRELYEPVPDQVILDDFLISMKIAQKGYRIVYEPQAYAMELPSFSIDEEKKRKIRIAAGGFQAMAMLPEALLFWKHPKLTFLYISHRVLRWTLSPLCLVTAFVTALLLTLGSGKLLYTIIFGLQLLFYASGLLYRVFPVLGRKIAILKLPYYFIFMNTSVILGFIRFLRGKQAATWEKAKRSNATFSGTGN
jgi:cellulose synthase/poly-beta-1,6-N-acetylglucosamine synthase-like glycosyltransferase